MRKINLYESQLNKLIESVTDGNFGENQIPEYQDQSKTTNQPKITKQNGEPTDANPKQTDKDFADMQTPQQWGSVGGRKSSNTI